MQILNLSATLNVASLEPSINTYRLGEGAGTYEYPELNNKPKINGVTLVGDISSANLGIKTSDLTNDSGYISEADIPTATSDLVNDSGFVNSTQVQSVVSDAIPSDISYFNNDVGYITNADISNIPTRTSQLVNDSGFVNAQNIPVQSVNGQTGAVELTAADIDYDSDNTVAAKIDAVEDSIPTRTSQLVNDSGFVNAQNIIQTGTIEDVEVASFSDGADNVPVSELIVDIEARQEGSGEPSPDNVRAITGFTECNVFVSGVNLWDEQTKTGYYSSAHGYYVNYAGQLCSKDYIAVKPNTTYVFKKPITLGDILYYGKNKDFLNVTLNITSKAYSFTTPDNCYYININLGSTYGAVYNNDVSINYPSSDTDYHSYIGNTYTVDFGQTVYGGYFDNRGNLVVTHGYIASYNGETINEPWISSMDNYTPNTSPSTGAQVVYPLTTPTALTITSENVKTLLGNNNIFANTGNIEKLVYFKTGCENIAKLIEAMIQ